MTYIQDPTGFLGRTQPAAGRYLHVSSPHNSTTSVNLGVGNLRIAPVVFDRRISFDRVGADIATAGEAGSKLRLGLYADDGNAYPGSLIEDFGTINGDSATVQEITLTTTRTLAPGVYWFAAAVQVVTVTQPTVRTNSGWVPPLNMVVSTTLPAAGLNVVIGHNQTGVSGALPATFTTTPVLSSLMPRIFIRAA